MATPAILFPPLKLAPGENLAVRLLGVALTLGVLLTGLSVIQAGVYPPWAGMLLLATTAGPFFIFFVTEFAPPLPVNEVEPPSARF